MAVAMIAPSGDTAAAAMLQNAREMMKNLSIAISTLVFFLTACTPKPPPPTSEVDSGCRVGVFGTDEHFVVLTQAEEEFLYSFGNGEAGIVGDPVVMGCGPNGVETAEFSSLQARAIQVENTHFVVDGIQLAGQLIEPESAGPETTLVVYAHGSEERGWIGSVRDPYQMVARGLSVFVYDKRGTGLSEGAYTQNFPQLAEDLVAASQEAKRLAKGRFGRFGLIGLSQGGWTAPLAAERAGADFIAIGYGLVVDIREEDAAQVELELVQAGYGAEVIAKAKKVTDATGLIAASGYTQGLETLDALRREYGGEAWFSSIQGGFSGVILGMSSEELRENGIPMYDRLNIDWSLVPLEVLRDVKVPQLWVLAGEDREAPVGKTMERLKGLREEGLPIEIYVFPGTDHGMWEFLEESDGSRQRTKVTEGFYDLMADWAQGDGGGVYGNSIEH